MPRIKTIEWKENSVVIVDQTKLPLELHYETIDTIESMYDAIKVLKVRGAPAIGIAAAFGIYLGIRGFPESGSSQEFIENLNSKATYLAGSRPTAVNLFWALERINRTGVQSIENGASIKETKEKILDEAIEILEEDRRTGRAIGEAGLELLKGKKTILTHCNAGGLATAEYGTALAPVYVGAEQGIIFNVYADETRPLLQGARITAFELSQAGIPVTLICDNMAASVMAGGRIDAVIVGADRITSNGDTANKIGTYGVALLARAHGIPFYVAAPFSTFDLSLHTGKEIPIEERGPEEVTCGFGKQTAPSGVKVYNPAFDVTPSHLISAFITDKGVITPPYERNLAEVLGKKG
ncbi:MAG TPA: S-methyl-5-thioribose-1-phosphate isomerase [Chitinispirillaceae bacterium]|nr:S-methyl-5-thioribose-1-phosphate isomerase [Chitinispirillaceae bacterium]